MATTQHKKHDVLIIGGGPGGSAAALYLLQAGIKPVILEKERFPRYHIGESLTGEAGGSLRMLGFEEKMQKARYPVKHGVNVYGPNGKNSFWVPVARRDENNQLQETTTWQVRRSEFDKMLVDSAIEKGAELIPGRAVAALVEDDRVTGLRVRYGNGKVEDIYAEVVIDASGQATFLANSEAPTGEKERGHYDKQLAIFSQVTNTIRDPGEASGNTLIFYRRKNHWGWFIPLDDEVVSVGIVVPGSYFAKQNMGKTEFLRHELRHLNAEMSRRIPNLTFVEDVHTASNYSYHVRRFTGKGFLCVGDSHRFIDPVFSFGVNFALKEAQFAAEAVTDYLGNENHGEGNPFAAYEQRSERGQDVIQDLVDVFWDRPLPFVMLVHHHHREGMIDLFAGRIFNDDVLESEALKALRMCLPNKRLAATN